MARKLDDYKPLAFYKKHTNSKRAGFSKFDVGDDYYFCRYVDGNIALLSQSYTSEAGRDNGIESVKKNEKLVDGVVIEERAGKKWGVSIKAGNGQEVAVSPDFDSKAQAEHLGGRLRGTIKAKPKKSPPKKKAPVKKTAAVASAAAAGAVAAKSKAANNEQNYKPLAFYQDRTESKDKGFATFKEDGQHYFAYYENGEIALISEGYPTTAARDVGMASVEKNMTNPDRYKYRGPLKKSKKYDFSLRAGNNKEIARSPWFGSAAAAATGAAYLIGTRKRASKKSSVAPIAAAAAIAGAAPVMAKAAKPVDKADDYLPCEAYQGHPVNDRVNNVALFKHRNGQFYFALYDGDGDVRLRSEGFPTAAARDQELSGVLRLKDNPDYYKRIESGDNYIDVLYDETGREVGRSCLCQKKAAVVPPVIPMAAAAAAPVAAAASAAPATAAAGPGIWSWLKWVLLALAALLAAFFLFKACTGPKEVAVTPPAPALAMVTCWDGSEAETQLACPTKVTCWDGSFVSNASACPAEPPKVETFTCWDGSTVEDLANCPVEPAPEPIVEPEPAPTVMPRGSATATSLFIAPAIAPTIVTRLGTNPEFGDSHTLTPAEFRDKLLGRAVVSDYDAQYLNYVAGELGYSSFADIPASAFSNATIANGSVGILGYGEAHGLQYSEFQMFDGRDLEAFRIEGANGRVIYYMKSCGNYFYPTQ